MKLEQFTQTNLVAVLERANLILANITEFGTSPNGQEQIIETLIKECDPGDEWERAAMYLAQVELMERRMRRDDPQLESAPDNWEGGIFHNLRKELES